MVASMTPNQNFLNEKSRRAKAYAVSEHEITLPMTVSPTTMNELT